MDINETDGKEAGLGVHQMLRMAMNVSWKQHMTNEELYGDLPKVITKIAIHRLRLAGHCVRRPEEIAFQLVLWQPVRNNAGRGRRQQTSSMSSRDTQTWTA